MPLPFILGAGALVAGAAGVGSGLHGAKKMKDANDRMKEAERRNEENMERFESESNRTNKAMDKLGKLELEILKSFEEFSNTIEKIQNRPEFKEYQRDGVELPKYDKEELQKVSVGAGVLLAGIGGAAAGTAGGVAASGAATTAVMMLGTASTGTAISSLSGAAATNAVLAALGGGSLATGGGGIALGTTILGASTLGVGLLVGGFIVNTVGSKLSDQAEEAYYQMRKAEEKIEAICEYLGELKSTANKYTRSLKEVREKYDECFSIVSNVVNNQGKVEWNEFTYKEQMALENTVMLVGLLYKMCKVNLVLKAENEEEMNEVNSGEVRKTIKTAENIIDEME